jgi:hypothetical protein
MSKQKMTKQQRAEREESLVLAILNGLVATIEEKAKAWAFKARDLREGLSATAIKRAERRAHKLADERPPGFVKAMEAMDAYEEMRTRYKISKRDLDAMWAAICQFCMFQLAAGSGPFFEAARYFGLTTQPPPAEEATRVPVVTLGVTRVRTPGCNCPNCRPRKAEELN